VLLYGVAAVAFAIIGGTCAMLVVGPRWLAAWCVVAVYVTWPAVWPWVKGVMSVSAGFLLPIPAINVPRDPELLGVDLTAGRLSILKTRVIRWLASLVELGLWPAAGVTERTLHTVTTGSARVQTPRWGTYAVVSALFAFVLIGGRIWAGTSIAVTVAAIGLLATITARHLLWILSGNAFRLLLKRSAPNPYVALVVLAVFDYIALVAIAVVLRWQPGSRISLTTAVTESRYLLELRHLTNLLQQSDLSPVVVCLAVATAAYWASLASQVLKFTSFRRDYDDRAWVAALTLLDGSVAEADKLLEPVPREHVSGPVLQMRIRLALAHSDMETARSQARALYHQLDPEHATEDGTIVYLAKQMSRAPVEPDNAWSIVQQGCAASISDGAMFAALRQMGKFITGTARNDKDGWEPRARTSALTPESYPIAWSWLQASLETAADAERTLERAKPANKADAAVRLKALQAAKDGQRSSYSAQDTDQELAEMLEALSSLPEECRPLWLRDFLFTGTWRLEKRGQAFGLPRHKELRALRRQLLPMPAGAAEAALEDFDIAENARIRASRSPWYTPGRDDIPGAFEPY
jgi:hypothetical protein